MGLAEPKIRANKERQLWQAAKHRKNMLDISIISSPSLSISMKMMETMGWKEGQGLGASQQGIAEPINLKDNFGQKGLGYSVESGAEQVHYAEQFERFQSVLSSLTPVNNKDCSSATPAVAGDKSGAVKKRRAGNNTAVAGVGNSSVGGESGKKTGSKVSQCSDDESPDTSDSGTSDSGTSDDEENTVGKPRNTTSQSLEALSRRPGGRMRYQKFTRSKDVSRYSAKDLACITGSLAHSRYNDSKQQDKIVVQGNLVHQHQNMKEYFSTLASSAAPSPPADEQETKVFTPSFQLSFKRDASDHDDGDENEEKPSFGGVKSEYEEGRPSFGCAKDSFEEDRPCFGGAKDSSEEDRPCFGGARDSFEDGHSFLASKDGDNSAVDAVSKCFQERFKMNYSNAFVKSDEGLGSTSLAVGDEGASCSEEMVAKTKKKKRNKKANEEQLGNGDLQKQVKESKSKTVSFAPGMTEEAVTERGSLEEDTADETRNSEKKSKKKKKKRSDVVEEIIISDCGENIETEDVSMDVKQTKKKRKKVDLDESVRCEVVDSVDNIILEKIIIGNCKVEDDSEEQQPPRKKSKKSKKSGLLDIVKEGSVEKEIANEVIDTHVKKQKKSKKNKLVDVEESVSDGEECTKKKKKKKKSFVNAEEDVVLNYDEPKNSKKKSKFEAENFERDISVEGKTPKKKKKSKL